MKTCFSVISLNFLIHLRSDHVGKKKAYYYFIVSNSSKFHINYAGTHLAIT